MSMLTRIQTQIKDIDALKRTLEQLGHKFKEGGTVNNGYETMSVDLKVEGHTLGFKKTEDGTYQMICNDMGRADREIGTKITQEYAALKAYESVRDRYTIKRSERTVLENGDIQLEIII